MMNELTELAEYKCNIIKRLDEKPTWGRRMIQLLVEEEYVKMLENKLNKNSK